MGKFLLVAFNSRYCFASGEAWGMGCCCLSSSSNKKAAVLMWPRTDSRPGILVWLLRFAGMDIRFLLHQSVCLISGYATDAGIRLVQLTCTSQASIRHVVKQGEL